MTIRDILSDGIRILSSPCPHAFIDTPSLDAVLLLGEVLNLRREEIISRSNESISEIEKKKFESLLTRRMEGECVAYILGRREFMGLEFSVDPSVLVPRPDTETLAETALEYINTMTKQNDKKSLSLLDLCTGSGALAISLKYTSEELCENISLSVTALDICEKALEIARRNAARLLGATEPPLHFIQSDLYEDISGAFDIIISNPPYIPTGEVCSLAPEVQREPALALDGGRDGLELIRKIIFGSREHLPSDGVLLLEAGSTQMPVIRTLLENGGFGDIRTYRDLAGRERVISGVNA